VATSPNVTKLSNGMCLRRLGVFENRLLRKIFGPKMDEGTGEWGRSPNA